MQIGNLRDPGLSALPGDKGGRELILTTAQNCRCPQPTASSAAVVELPEPH